MKLMDLTLADGTTIHINPDHVVAICANNPATAHDAQTRVHALGGKGSPTLVLEHPGQVCDAWKRAMDDEQLALDPSTKGWHDPVPACYGVTDGIGYPLEAKTDDSERRLRVLECACLLHQGAGYRYEATQSADVLLQWLSKGDHDAKA